MDSVSLNPCVNSGLTGNHVSRTYRNIVSPGFASLDKDTVSIRNKKEIYAEKLERLFPDGELDRIYNKINEDFGLDNPPALKFYGDDDGVMSGGYTFNRNEISLSLSDLLSSDTKIVGIKDDKRTILVSPKVHLPLFVDNRSANSFVAVYSKIGNLGYDKLVTEPVTDEEQRKLIIQKLTHEIVHAQQHMIMRQAEGIGEKEIIKAWTHEKPKNMVAETVLNYKVNDIYNRSYWAEKPDTKKTITKDSPKYHYAKVWLEAIRNYPSVDSPDYVRNPIEIDAYVRSAQYVKAKYGDWV